MFPTCIPGEIKRRTMYLGRILPLRMRIKQAAWKSSVGVRELLVWQRNCQHIKIAWVLNKTETCTIYTCQREKHRESASLTRKISIVTYTPLHVKCESRSFMSEWISQCGRYSMFTWQGRFKCNFWGRWGKSFVYSSTFIMTWWKSFERGVHVLRQKQYENPKNMTKEAAPTKKKVSTPDTGHWQISAYFLTFQRPKVVNTFHQKI